MPSYPIQTFSTIADVVAYVNNNVITNGDGEIDAVIVNNVLNGLAKFIGTATINYQTAAVQAGGGAVVLSVPVTIFTAAPTSIQWPNNIYNEYYIINASNVEIPLASGYFYRDINLTTQSGILPRSVVHIAKTSTGQWMQINNMPDGGGSLPSQTGHEGQNLYTNGTGAQWLDGGRYINSADFESDGKTVLLSDLDGFGFFVFWNDIPRYLYEGTEWQYADGGGFEIVMDGFDARIQDVNIFLTLKGSQ